MTQDYTIGHEQGAVDLMRVRTADHFARQILPYLRPGMRVLDCGCGPGSITIGLARAVDPGEAVGVDLEAGQTDMATRLAAELAIPNVRFEPADATALPFPDASFDAVHAHALLMHVSDPAAVLAEMFRVLKSGGVIGVSDTILDAWFATGPEEDLLQEAFGLIQKAARAYGGDWNRGRNLGPLLHAAGFARVEASALYRAPSPDDSHAANAALFAGMIDGTRLGNLIVESGLATRDHLARIIAAWRSLGSYPDAFFLAAEGEAVGWKP